MEFKTEAQKKSYEMVGGWLRELFGEMAYARTDMPTYALTHGSAVVNIGVNSWGEEDTIISVYAWVVLKADLRPDLLLFLLNKNVNVRFGAFGVDDAGDIIFQHAIVGSSADKKELKASVMAVIYTADETDDAIVSRWGGKRATDR